MTRIISLLLLILISCIPHATHSTATTTSSDNSLVNCGKPTDPVSLQFSKTDWDTTNGKITVSAGGSAASTLPVDAQVEIVASVLGKEIHRERMTMCEFVGTKSVCPVPAGSFSGSKTVDTGRGLNANTPFINIDLQFRVVSPTQGALGCYTTSISPPSKTDVEKGALAVSLSIAALAGLSALATIVIATGSSIAMFLNQAFTNAATQNNMLHRTNSPGVMDIIYYCQFISLTSSLELEYPEFLKTFGDAYAWSNFWIQIPGVTNAVDKISKIQGPDSGSSNLNSNSTTSIETRLLKRQLPNCSITTPGPAGECPNVGECCSPFGTCGTTSNFCMPGSSAPKTANNNNNNTNKSNSTKITTTSKTGLNQMADKLGIAGENLFLVSLVILFIALFIVTGLFLLCGVFIEIFIHFFPQKLTNWKSHLWSYWAGNMFRVYLWGYFGLTATSLNQFFINNPPWYMTAISAVFLSVFLITLVIFVTIKIFRIRPARRLFSETSFLAKYGPAYNSYTSQTFQFFIPFIVYKFGTAAALGLGSKLPILQMALLITLEIAYLTLLFQIRPFNDRCTNRMHYFISVMKIVSVALLVSYLQEVAVGEPTKSVIGWVMVLVHLVVFVVFGVLVLRNLFKGLLRKCGGWCQKWIGCDGCCLCRCVCCMEDEEGDEKLYRDEEDEGGVEDDGRTRLDLVENSNSYAYNGNDDGIPVHGKDTPRASVMSNISTATLFANNQAQTHGSYAPSPTMTPTSQPVDYDLEGLNPYLQRTFSGNWRQFLPNSNSSQQIITAQPSPRRPESVISEASQQNMNMNTDTQRPPSVSVMSVSSYGSRISKRVNGPRGNPFLRS